MKSPSSEIKFYSDTAIVETLLTKNAEGGVSDLISGITSYVNSHIDQDNKTQSILNILSPGVVFTALRAMGLGWLGILLGLAINVFHIDVHAILSSIYEKVKEFIQGNKQLSSQQVDNMVSSSVQEHMEPASKQEAQTFLETKQFSQHLKDAKLLKIAMYEYHFNKNADFLGLFSKQKSTAGSLLTTVLSWFFKIALSAAGLMVAGDIVNKFLGRPNAIDKNYQEGKTDQLVNTPSVSNIPLTTSTQTKFKLNPSYHNEKYNVNSLWSEPILNDQSSIEQMLVDFAKEVYSGLDGLDNVIKDTPGFNVVSNRITWYNKSSSGDNVVFIPKYFTSKKDIVDLFIDDVAKKSS